MSEYAVVMPAMAGRQNIDWPGNTAEAGGCPPSQFDTLVAGYVAFTSKGKVNRKCLARP